MKKYKVRITPDAKEDLRNILAYLKNKYHNQQAVKMFGMITYKREKPWSARQAVYRNRKANNCKNEA